jgi:hypothetical protein
MTAAQIILVSHPRPVGYRRSCGREGEMSRALQGACAPGSNQRGTCWLFEFHSFAPFQRRRGGLLQRLSLPRLAGGGFSFRQSFGRLIS